MSDFLQAILDAHGGMDRWKRVRSIELELNFSGIGVELKGFPRHLRPHLLIDAKEQRTVIDGIGGAQGEKFVYTPRKVWGERPDGSVTTVLDNPREALKAIGPTTTWEPVQFAYFLGYAIRNYLSVPFVLASPGVQHRELDLHIENGETWRVLEVTYPDDIAVHTSVQKLYFGPDYLLRRVDYSVDVLGGGAANHYCYDYRSFDGIMVPTVRRVTSPFTAGPFIAGLTTIFLLDYISLAFQSN